jgi:hypothetical protein
MLWAEAQSQTLSQVHSPCMYLPNWQGSEKSGRGSLTTCLNAREKTKLTWKMRHQCEVTNCYALIHHCDQSWLTLTLFKMIRVFFFFSLSKGFNWGNLWLSLHRWFECQKMAGSQSAAVPGMGFFVSHLVLFLPWPINGTVHMGHFYAIRNHTSANVSRQIGRGVVKRLLMGYVFRSNVNYPNDHLVTSDIWKYNSPFVLWGCHLQSCDHWLVVVFLFSFLFLSHFCHHWYITWSLSCGPTLVHLIRIRESNLCIRAHFGGGLCKLWIVGTHEILQGGGFTRPHTFAKSSMQF